MPDNPMSYINANYKAFQALLPEIVQDHRSQYALMRDGQIIEFYDTARDAFLVGQHSYPDARFSVQEVVDTPIELGFFSHAVSEK